MQPIIFRLVGFLTIFSFFLTSCKKDHDIIKPSPEPPVKSNQYQFVIAALPGEPATGTSGLSAQVMVVNEKNETVLENVKLPLEFDGQYKTSKLELPTGQYRVVKFLINNQANQTRFAAPVTGSEKASQVSKPLYVSFRLPQNAVTPVPVEVLRVENTDIPENFGYPAGSFHQDNGNHPPDGGSPFVKIKLRAFAQIGDIYYDSIPATINLTIINKIGPATRKTLTLAAGTNEIELPKAAHRYEFEMSKWGINSKVELNWEQVREGELYGIGGSIAPKKLKQELTYRLVNGAYVPERKVQYSYYNGNGHLHRIDYYEKGANAQPSLVRYEVFSYNTDNKITRIGQYSANDVYQGDISFIYNSMGKPYYMVQTDAGVETSAEVTYYQTPGRNNAHIKYTYSHNSNTMDYNLAYEKGNLVESSVATSNQSSQTGLYQYDLNINPFIHLGRPDIYLSNQSKNNVVAQQKQFTGSYPNAYSYKFDYTYDNEGYPKEVITGYLSPVTNTHSYTLKTIYTYL